MLELTIYICCNCIEVYSDIHVILNTVKYNKKYLKKKHKCSPGAKFKKVTFIQGSIKLVVTHTCKQIKCK